MPPSPAAANWHRSGAEAFEMITLRRTPLALVAVLALPAAAALGAADRPMSDTAGCNKQAAEKTGASVAPPPPGARSPQTAARAPDGSREPRELPAHGGIPVAGAPGTNAEQPRQHAPPSGEKTDPRGPIITA